eukprot:4508688-Amphidinium_carterae.1
MQKQVSNVRPFGDLQEEPSLFRNPSYTLTAIHTFPPLGSERSIEIFSNVVMSTVVGFGNWRSHPWALLVDWNGVSEVETMGRLQDKQNQPQRGAADVEVEQA